ncbi:MAG: thiamine-phosphate kinase, partial [Sphingopyxis sp.]|nr:thiamine-phosphate kinase [Sphingopyxis sp.]
MTESAIIAAMRAIATSPAARGLVDDAAVLDVGGQSLVLTHDMLVEGRHFRSDDPARSAAWKLVAANMSDLAAKGAAPLGVLIGYGMARGEAWDSDFAAGLADALRHFAVPLLGGDTVAMPRGGPATLGLTAIGLAPACGAPSRSGAMPGDDLWVSACVGDAGAGLAQGLVAENDASRALSNAYLYPQPNVALGQSLAPLVSAMT